MSKHPTVYSRRNFTKLSAMGLASIPLLSFQNGLDKILTEPSKDLEVHLFSKHLQFLNYNDMSAAVVEGGESWELGLRRIKPFINSIVLKDFKWDLVRGKWKSIHVPMGEGMVDFNRYFSLLKKYKIKVPVSLHVEYDLGGAEKGSNKITITEKEVFKRIKKDLAFIKETWKNAE